MELRRYNNTPFVQIFYKNTTATPKSMNIPNCGYFCPLDKLFQLYSDILPEKSFDNECKLEPMMLSYAETDLGTVKGNIYSLCNILLPAKFNVKSSLKFYLVIKTISTGF